MDSATWDYSVFWKEALNQIREELSEQEYLMWFKNIEYARSEEKSVIVAVPSSFYKDQIKQRYLPIMQSKLFELSGNDLKIDFEIKKAEVKESPKPSSAAVSKPAPAKEKRVHSQLRSEYTFDNFVIGENNSFAANAAIAIAKNPGKAYNPCQIGRASCSERVCHRV